MLRLAQYAVFQNTRSLSLAQDYEKVERVQRELVAAQFSVPSGACGGDALGLTSGRGLPALVGQAGHKKVIIAVAHRLFAAIYHMLKDPQRYREIDMAPPSEPAKRERAERLQLQLEKLSYTMTMAPVA